MNKIRIEGKTRWAQLSERKTFADEFPAGKYQFYNITIYINMYNIIKWKYHQTLVCAHTNRVFFFSFLFGTPQHSDPLSYFRLCVCGSHCYASIIRGYKWYIFVCLCVRLSVCVGVVPYCLSWKIYVKDIAVGDQKMLLLRPQFCSMRLFVCIGICLPMSILFHLETGAWQEGQIDFFPTTKHKFQLGSCFLELATNVQKHKH